MQQRHGKCRLPKYASQAAALDGFVKRYSYELGTSVLATNVICNVPSAKRLHAALHHELRDASCNISVAQRASLDGRGQCCLT